MDRKPVLLALLLVPISSLLGLTRAMIELDGWEVFTEVWATNLWGDLVFVGGTVGVVLGAWALAGRVGGPKGTAFGLAAGFFGHWATYTLAWAFTGPASSFVDPGLSFTDGPLFTLAWGWPGLVALPLAAVAWIRLWPQEGEPVPGPTA